MRKMTLIKQNSSSINQCSLSFPSNPFFQAHPTQRKFTVGTTLYRERWTELILIEKVLNDVPRIILWYLNPHSNTEVFLSPFKALGESALAGDTSGRVSTVSKAAELCLFGLSLSSLLSCQSPPVPTCVYTSQRGFRNICT